MCFLLFCERSLVRFHFIWIKIYWSRSAAFESDPRKTMESSEHVVSQLDGTKEWETVLCPVILLYLPTYSALLIWALLTVVGKMTTFDLWPIPLGGGAWGAGTNMWHPETPASYESLPAPLATQIPTLCIHTSGGRGRGGALILDRCRVFDLFASVDAHLCLLISNIKIHIRHT